MTRRAYIFVPGILNYPGSARGWTDRAVTHIHNCVACACAEKFEYLALPATRNLFARTRAVELAALMDQYPSAQFSLVLAGHSFGCELIRLAVGIAKRPANFVHLFAPAVPATPRKHRLKSTVASGRIEFLSLYISARDRVLTKSFLGGLSAESVQAQFADAPPSILFAAGGHSRWFDADNFSSSMQHIIGDTPCTRA